MPPPLPKCTDITCPCWDGDACHYEAVGNSEAWPMPPTIHRFDPTNQEHMNMLAMQNAELGGVGWPE
jgi:hypothetical protein